jgi:6-phosphogluconolactonase/glucosamine-6-phosphate isomerase/deaminase
MDINYSDTPARTAGKELTQILHQHLPAPILLLCSGGSALSLLEYAAISMGGSQITISTLDERYSRDPDSNNFAQLQSLPFYREARNLGVGIIDTRIAAHETLHDAAKRFASELSNWRTKHPRGVIVATMGLGEDGHTAGIFPVVETISFADDQEWVMGYELPKGQNRYSKRITTTYSFLRHEVTEAVLYVTGERKARIFEKLQQTPCDCAQYPICVVHDMPRVRMVTNLSAVT